MINSVGIHNFKLFKDVQQELKPLTLLTGLNGRGKSTFIQAMLTMWHTLNEDDLIFSLDNEYVRLGIVEDVLPWTLDDNRVGLSLTINEKRYELYSEEVSAEWSQENIIPLVDDESDMRRMLELPHLHYLAAGRMPVMDRFPTASQSVKKKSLSIRYGDGMATARFLYEYGKELLKVPELVYPTSEFLTLENQANAWLKVISPDLDFHVRRLGSDFQIRYSTVNAQGIPLSANASNVGYGITYALPMITAILSSSPGDVVIVETPEAHIHPAGQARLMDLCALAAANGIQVILETHSDHIVHGVLRNLKKEVLKEDDVAVLFFDKEIDEEQPCIVPQKVTQKGRIRKPSPGFFDQYMNDMDALL